MKKNLYCEHCNELTYEQSCPKCGKPTREPKHEDMCFIQELSGINASMFTDALSNNGIEFVHVPSFNTNVVNAPMFQGVNWNNAPSSYKFYVHYADYDQAVEVLDVIFGEQEEELDDYGLIDRIVKVIIDRPVGSIHPEHPDIKYELNYGYVEGVMGGDGEEQDAYILDWPKDLSYVGKEVNGFVVAVIRRKNDVETKWVVSVDAGKKYTRDEIEKATHFQEKYFDIEIIM